MKKKYLSISLLILSSVLFNLSSNAAGLKNEIEYKKKKALAWYEYNSGNNEITKLKNKALQQSLKTKAEIKKKKALTWYEKNNL